MDDLENNIELVTSYLSSISFKFLPGIVDDCKKLYSELVKYVNNQHVPYSKEVGDSWINNGSQVLANLQNQQMKSKLCAACISMLDQAYKRKNVNNIPLPRVKLKEAFTQEIEEFLSKTESNGLKKSYQTNARCHCNLFAAYLQANGMNSFSEMTYATVKSYYEDVISNKLQCAPNNWLHDTFVTALLKYLSDKGIITCGFHIYFHYYGEPFFVNSLSCNVFTDKEMSDTKAEVSLNALKETMDSVVNEMAELGYSGCMMEHTQRTYRLFICSLDMAGLNYTNSYADQWLQAFKRQTDSSSYHMSARAIFVLKDMIYKGSFHHGYLATAPREVPPEWARSVLTDFLKEKAKLKYEKSTLAMYRSANVHFLQIVDEMGIHDFKSITRETVMQFNVKDTMHKTTFSKNAYNSRIRNFLRYLARNNVITDYGLADSLLAASSSSERLVIILNDDEIEKLTAYCKNASTPMEYRDSAILLIGLKTGLRAIDIINLRLSDIDWHNRTIHLCQQKTKVDITLPMPTDVGNAIFRYLKDGRPKGINEDALFVNLSRGIKQGKKISQDACLRALHRALPDRNVEGSGFHVLRKTFSSKLLEEGIAPDEIANLLGHVDSSSVHKYLANNTEKMKLCALPLSGLPELREKMAM